MDNITLCSSQVYLSEENTDPDKYLAKFILCDFGRNKNGVALNRNEIENWMSSIIDNPLVGKIKMKYDGTSDFSGHNVTVVTKKDENGNEYQDVLFDTDAFGSFKSIEIEEIDNKEYLVATCVIWKRFETACNLILKRIKEGTLFTSWEVAVEKSHKGIVDGLMTKIIDAGRFIGHCLLSQNTPPAYDSSHLLEIASTELYDMEFAEAISHDMRELSINEKIYKEDNLLKNEENLNLSSEEINESEVEITDTENAPAENEASENTSEDTPENVSEIKEDEEDEKDVDDKPEEDDVDDDVEDKDDEEDEDKSETDTSKCGGGSDKKKKKTSEVSETETSQLTDYDLRCKIARACESKAGRWCYVSFMFPEEKEVWVRGENCETELDYLRFTYSVENDEVTVSDAEKVKLTVAPREVNATISELNEQISSKDEIILKSSQTITELNAQITELSQYKEKFEKSEQEKIEAELAQEKEQLISSVVSSGQITREEIESSEEMKGYVNNLDKKSLMAIVGERLLSSVAKKESKVETSEAKENMHIATNLNDADEETVTKKDKISAMRRYLNK